MEKVIFELKINKKNSIIAVKCEDYDSVYFDSKLYFIKNNKKKFFVNDSFSYGFGPEMYLRINNVHEYNKQQSFVKAITATLNDSLNGIFEPEKTKIYDYYIFVNGCQDQAFYLYKSKKAYKLIFIKSYLIKGAYSTRVNKKYTLTSEQINEWKQIINSAYEQITKDKGENAFNVHQSDEEWKLYFEYMRSDDPNKTLKKV